MHATAGSLIGIGEIVLLPLDVLKIKRQTNPEAFRGRGVFRIVADEGMGLYRGAGWTAARNAPGSFAVRILLFLLTPSSGSKFANALSAFRWFRLRQRISLQPHRLQHRLLLPKLRRLHRRRFGFSHRLRSPRRHQNPYPEPKFREPGVWAQDCGLDDEERRHHEFLQGFDAEAVDDGAEAGVQFLAGTDADPGVWSGRLSIYYSRYGRDWCGSGEGIVYMGNNCMYHGRETLHFAGLIDIGSEKLNRRIVRSGLPFFWGSSLMK